MQILLEITGNRNCQIHRYRMLQEKKTCNCKMKPNASLNNDARKLADSSVYYLQLSAMLHSYEEIQYYSAAFGSSPLRKGRKEGEEIKGM